MLKTYLKFIKFLKMNINVNEEQEKEGTQFFVFQKTLFY